ncbi:MAG: gliding motility-associated C-terminal domain-containing protein [Bacteroidetes bacterium]|nr:MAG: gliding motility-associated C-terminal domain-containing protein [Bacteroidota bacterium]
MNIKRFHLWILCTLFFSIKAAGLSPQNITFASIPNQNCFDSIKLFASASSGLIVSFAIIGNNGSISGNHFIPSKLGLVSIRAYQTGNAIFDSARSVIQTFYVTSQKQTEANNLSLNSDSQLCIGQSAKLFLKSISGLNYNWNFLDGKTHEGTDYFIQTITSEINTSGTIFIKENSCNILTINFLLKVHENTPLLIETRKDTLFFGDTITLKPIPKGGTFSGKSMINDVFTAGFEAKTDTITYNYTNKNGCKSNMKKIFHTISKPEENFKVYEYVTPNNDGKNDYFHVNNISKYIENELVIFNQWNNELFRKKNYDNTWTPTNLDNGMYFWHFTDISTSKSYKGYFYVSK